MTAPDYQPPAGQGASGPRASFGRRLVAIVIDSILVGIVYGILYVISKPLAVIVLIVLELVYWSYFEGSRSGQTIGKKIMGIRVIDYNTGGPLGFGRGFVRQLARIPSGIVCYLGYLWMLWDKEKQTWHDKLASTVVVPESAYPVESWPG
jgi:uncharacterized RDD family membrane protein YckC